MGVVNMNQRDIGLRPFFCYYGGKWRAAPKYPKPEQDTIVEPFAGAAGYSTRHHTRRVLLIEKDPVIAGLWQYLINVKASEVLSIPLLGHDQTIDDLGNVPQEAKSLVGFWLSKGSAVPKRSPSTWMRAGTHVTSFWGEAIRQRIASQVEHIRHWECRNESYKNAPAVEATWFIDPPYCVVGKHYRCGPKDIEFGHLAAWSRRQRGLVLVCENAGAKWLPFKPFATIQASPAKHGGKRSAEVLYTTRNDLSRPSLAYLQPSPVSWSG